MSRQRAPQDVAIGATLGPSCIAPSLTHCGLLGGFIIELKHSANIGVKTSPRFAESQFLLVDFQEDHPSIDRYKREMGKACAAHMQNRLKRKLAKLHAAEAAATALTAAALASQCAQQANDAAFDAWFFPSGFLPTGFSTESGSDTDQFSDPDDFEANPPARKRMRDQISSGRLRIDSGYEMEMLLCQQLKKLKI